MPAYPTDHLEALALGKGVPREVSDAVLADPEAVRRFSERRLLASLFEEDPLDTRPPQAPSIASPLLALGAAQQEVPRRYEGEAQRDRRPARPTAAARSVAGGILATDAERLLSGDEGRAEVLAEEARYKASGVGVPAFFIGGEFAFGGAVEPRLLADAIRSPVVAPSQTWRAAGPSSTRTP